MTRANDDDAEHAFRQQAEQEMGPPVTLSGRAMERIRFALEQADIALDVATESKLRRISGTAREARTAVLSAWGELPAHVRERRR